MNQLLIRYVIGRDFKRIDSTGVSSDQQECVSPIIVAKRSTGNVPSNILPVCVYVCVGCVCVCACVCVRNWRLSEQPHFVVI